MVEKTIEVKDYLTASKLPASDFVINPYIGCLHACKYCYACFMKRFANHDEPWGEFIDVKFCDKPINLKKIKGKSVFLSSVTDCYNPLEEKYKITQRILIQLLSAECEVVIATKSALILRDLELLKQFKNLKVAITVNTLDENFKNDMDKASSVADRISALKILHENGIYTALFMSPIFPKITNFKDIITSTKEFVDIYWFENLNLRGSYKPLILNYIREKYADVFPMYSEIYIKNNRAYWDELAKEIKEYCLSYNIKYNNYFYHEEIRKN